MTTSSTPVRSAAVSGGEHLAPPPPAGGPALQAPPPMPDTHGINYYEADKHLVFLLRRLMVPEDFARAEPHLRALGALASERLDELSTVANKNGPQLVQYNQRG